MNIVEWNKRLNRNKKIMKVGDRIKVVYAGRNPSTGFTLGESFLSRTGTILDNKYGDTCHIRFDGKPDFTGEINIARLDYAIKNYPKESLK